MMLGTNYFSFDSIWIGFVTNKRKSCFPACVLQKSKKMIYRVGSMSDKGLAESSLLSRKMLYSRDPKRWVLFFSWQVLAFDGCGFVRSIVLCLTHAIFAAKRIIASVSCRDIVARTR